jgi:hypothetical protein
MINNLYINLNMYLRFSMPCQANPATKVKVIEAMRVIGCPDLEAKEMTNMMGRRRGPQPFKAMKMRTEEELVACGGGGAQGSNFCGIRI